jgi:nucleotide-binding universal stress UspA family protein
MSAIKTLLVHADAGRRCGARLRAGRLLAERLQAGLHALYAVTPTFMEIPLELAAGGSPVMLAQEIDEGRLQIARKVRDQVASEPGPSIEWHEATGMPFSAFTQQARYADLLVLGQHDPEHRSSGVPSDFTESVVIASGRPALVLPYVDTAKTLGTTVLVAWKETPEAARAVSTALPLLKKAERVHVATWGAQETPEVPDGLDIGSYLRAHGIEPQLHRTGEAGAEVGELIQSLAADLSADLLVMGCYGHTRSRELVLGGASRSLLRSMALPVLMSH